MQLDVLSDDRKTYTPVSPGNPLPVTETTLDSTGLAMPAFSSMTVSYTYNTDSTISTEAYTNGVNTWTRTLGWTLGLLTSVSGWVKS